MVFVFDIRTTTAGGPIGQCDSFKQSLNFQLEIKSTQNLNYEKKTKTKIICL